MAGILSAIKLREAGLTDFTVYEKADRVGGTWRENTYPGLSCDVPSHLYSYSFALNPEWSHRFSPGPEIRAYFEQVAEEHGVVPHVRFGDAVTACTFSDGRWTVTTASGHQDEVDVVIAATGVLHHPRYPDIDGLDTFAGAVFHSARWDPRACSSTAPGSASSGRGRPPCRSYSAVVDRVARLSLFQRTAQWVMPQENPAYTDEERAALRDDPTNWPRTRQELSDMFDLFSNAVVDVESAEIKMIEQACLANLEDNVHDPELRERLRPDYRAACKRLIISPDFYDAIQRPNAELVTEAIERIEPGGVRTADGRLHELDVLVLATGFKADSFMRPMEVIGRNGITLEQAWTPAARGLPLGLHPRASPTSSCSTARTARSATSRSSRWPSCSSATSCSSSSASGPASAGRSAPRPSALAEFEQAREEAAHQTVWVTGCQSWYLDDRGIPTGWPWSFPRFRQEMRAPDPAAYECS